MDIFDLPSLHFFFRLVIGLLIISSAVSKLAHPKRFRNGIQAYHIIPDRLESALALSTVGAYGIPLAELGAGLGLVGGVLLVPTALLAVGLLTLFSGVLFVNLIRGRTDLSCHCGGVLGNHRISWKLLVRNLVLIALLILLLWMPSDLFTLDTLLYDPLALDRTAWLETALPLFLIGIVPLIIGILFTAIHRVVRDFQDFV